MKNILAYIIEDKAMKFNGEIKGVQLDMDRNYLLTVTIPKSDVESILKAQGKKMAIEIKRAFKKRSKNANDYAWVLMQEIAEVLKIPKEEVYVRELKKWSRSFDYMIIKKRAIENLYKSKTFRYIEIIDEGKSNGEDTCQIIGYWGSSTFDTKEMSVFIDGLVTDAKELGISTETPEEIARLKSLWKG